MLPYALRDPYRLSHFTSPLYRSLWPDAKDYLIGLNNAANSAVIDMTMSGAVGLFAFGRPDVHGRLGRATTRRSALEAAPRNGTRPPRSSVSTRSAMSYLNFKKQPGAYADNTIEKLGQAVTLE